MLLYFKRAIDDSFIVIYQFCTDIPLYWIYAGQYTEISAVEICVLSHEQWYGLAFDLPLFIFLGIYSHCRVMGRSGSVCGDACQQLIIWNFCRKARKISRPTQRSDFFFASHDAFSREGLMFTFTLAGVI